IDAAQNCRAWSEFAAACAILFALQDRVGRRGFADGLTASVSGMGRIGQTATTGDPTIMSSLKAAMVSSVMDRGRCTAHSSFCFKRPAPKSGCGRRA
ncbi:MAG TPA: hypothetical protein VEF36_15795, partial [Roseiarcus sp.]|nr:hypothetical protein [Roseiarcus sp.]